MLEQRYSAGEIELYYGDETQISEAGYVPYGWQGDENIAIASARGAHLHCFGILTRRNEFMYETTGRTIDPDFIIDQLEMFSFSVTKHTVVVLDNARVHQSKKMKARQVIRAKRNLFIFLLPPYSPHLNIIERLWKEIKARWLAPKDYDNEEQLFYAAKLILNAIGHELTINFKIA